MAQPAKTSEPAAAPAPPKRGKGKLIVILVVVLLVLGGAGAGGYYYAFVANAKGKGKSAKSKSGNADKPKAGDEHAEGDAADAHGEDAEDNAHAVIVPLEPFVANLADEEGRRFVKTTIKLVIGDESGVSRLEHDEVAKARLRSAVLEVLAEQTAVRLTSAEGKKAVKAAIAERASKILQTKVLDVLFTDFLVQF